MVNENPEKKSNSLNEKVKDMGTLSDDLWAALSASWEDEKTSSEESVENYEENLGILIDKYISDTEVGAIFLKFCEVECGWAVEYSVDIMSFMACLDNFRKERPQYAQYIKIDERYL